MDLIPLMGFSAFTISQPMKEMGTAAAELLLSRIEGKNSAPPALKRLKTGIIVHRPVVP